MSVLGRLLISSAQRLDLPDLLSIDSYAAGDFKYLIQGLVGDNKPYIIKGFDVINPGDAIGSQNISVRVADSVVLYPSSLAGPFFHGLGETHPQAQPLVPELRKNAVNYVYLTFSTFNTASDTRAFWDVDANGGAGAEFTQDVNTESVLKVDINVSTSAFPENTIPVCKVTVGPTVITKIEDSRDLMFRLANGGVSPDPYSTYNFRPLPSAGYERADPPTSMSTALAPNPFQGADKNILSLKEWMDVVMTKLLELGGSSFWYDDTSTYSLINIFQSALATSFKSKGQWQHSSATPGLLTWTEDILLKSTADLRDVIIRAGNKTLADEQIMYVELIRNASINPTDTVVSWINSSNTVNGVIGSFQNLTKGDWIKKKNDPNNRYLRVEEFYANSNLGGGVTTAANARSIKLSANYTGTTEDARSGYTKGVYSNANVIIANRNDSTVQSLGGNAYWLAIRSDTIENVSNITSYTVTGNISEGDGTTAKFVSLAHGLVDGDRVTIASGIYAGTYIVEVEDADTFYINTSVTTPAAATAFYAIVTTTTRSTTDGLLLESAAHNFEDGEKITIAGTSSSFDSSFLIKKRSTTSFSIPVSSAIPMVSTGTATLARITVRSDFGATKLVQGQSTNIGEGDATNIRAFVGMGSPAETFPIYSIPPSYNTLDGMQNYNSSSSDNLTARVSKLTAMMADKSQDRVSKFLPAGLNSIQNLTNGLAQEITFLPSGGTLTIGQPGSPGNTLVFLPDTAPGISLLANQVAYVVIDRNQGTTASIVIVDIEDCPIDENVHVLAVRLNSTDVWLWDGSIITVGTIPVPSYLPKIVRQNLNAKLIAGGNWNWDSGTNIVSYQLNNTSPFTNIGTWNGNSAIGFSFIASTNGTIDQVTAQFKVLNGAPDAQFEAVLYTNNTNQPGTVISTSTNTLSTTSLSGSFSSFTFNFSSGALVNGTTYWMVFLPQSIVTLDPSNGIGIAEISPFGGLAASAPSPFTSWSLTPAFGFCGSITSYITGAPALTWSADANIQIPGLANTVNAIPAGSTTLNAGEVAYVEVNRLAPGGSLTVNTSDIAALTPTDNTMIIARRVNNDVVVGDSILLVNGETKPLYAGLSNQNLTYIGAPSEASDAPDYDAITVAAGSLDLPDYNGVAGESLTSRLAKVTAMLADVRQDLNIILDPGAVTWNGTNISITGAKLSIPGTTIGAAPVAINNYTSSPLADNECLYVDIDRVTGTALTLAVSTLAALTPAQQRLIIARRLGTDIYLRAS